MDKIPQVYQQRNTFYYKVNINGHRVTRKAEGSTLAQAQRHVDRLYRTNKLDSPTHASVLASFMDPETNPRYKDARITGVESGRNEHDSSAERDTIAKLINIVI